MTHGFVYLIGNKEHGWYKIGFSKKPEERLHEIARALKLPFPIELVRKWDAGKQTRKIERELHHSFAHRHCPVDGKRAEASEWFSLSTEDMVMLEALVQHFLTNGVPRRPPTFWNHAYGY